MRNKIIVWFMADHPEDITEKQELQFYAVFMAIPIIGIGAILITL